MENTNNPKTILDQPVTFPPFRQWPRSIKLILLTIMLGSNAGDLVSLVTPVLQHQRTVQKQVPEGDASVTEMSREQAKQLLAQTNLLLMTTKEAVLQQKLDHEQLIEQRVKLQNMGERLNKLESRFSELERRFHSGNGKNSSQKAIN